MLQRIWLKNTKGEPSASLSMAVITFSVILVHYILWVVGAALGLIIPPFDASNAMMFLGPMLGLYWGRRSTSVKEREVELDHRRQNRVRVGEK